LKGLAALLVLGPFGPKVATLGPAGLPVLGPGLAFSRAAQDSPSPGESLGAKPPEATGRKE
jgi:hypothetical protein